MSTQNTPQKPLADDGPSKLPRHVAIIMDGNGRWAEKRHRPRFMGHKAGVETVREIVRLCAERKIAALTLFAFSSENWRRPKKEVTLLLELLTTALNKEVNKLHENNVRLQIIGDCQAFPAGLQQRITEAQDLTADNTGLILNIAINYGGRWDVVQAARQLAELVEQGHLTTDQIDEGRFSQGLALHDLPEPDLFIRTGGEQRISNFLLWHLAYTELYFTDTLWPDFDGQAFNLALASFAARQRRFGRTGEQVGYSA